MLRRRSAVGHGSLPCSCPMWIYCQDCSVPAQTGAGSGTSATHLAVRERDEKSKNIEKIADICPPPFFGGGGKRGVLSQNPSCR